MAFSITHIAVPIDLAVLCPLREEFEGVAAHLEDRQPQARVGLRYEVGTLRSPQRDWKVGLFETGSGTVNLAAKTTRIIDHFRPAFIFLVGIAGGVKDAAIGDVVIASEAIGYDSGKDTEDDFLARPKVINSPPRMIELLRQLARDLEKKVPYRIFLGPIASGEKVLASKDSYTARSIAKLYNNTLAVEMEAYGFADAARTGETPYANIRGISDLLDGKHHSDHDGSRTLATQRAADFWRVLVLHLHEWEASAPPFEFPFRAQGLFSTSSPSPVLPVQYLQRPHRSWWSPRWEPRADLYRYPGGLVLKGKRVELKIGSPDAIEPYRMPGDLAKRWVALSYRDAEGQSRKVYLSDARYPFLANLLGGGKSLARRLTEDYFS
ncbi:MAG: 5'-methylthioadenosine/S-adenosylhomocysteine nucleosidase [Bacteroidota bacterium]